MKRIVIIVLAFAALTGCTPRPGTITWHNVSSGRCEEDMPCWDCHTMGNHICGTLPDTH